MIALKAAISLGGRLHFALAQELPIKFCATANRNMLSSRIPTFFRCWELTMRNRTAYISITFQLPPAKIAIRKEKVDFPPNLSKGQSDFKQGKIVSSQEEKFPQFFMAFNVP